MAWSIRSLVNLCFNRIPRKLPWARKEPLTQPCIAVESLIRRAADEAQRQLDALYASGAPPSGSALDQCGLRDGLEIVEDYLVHGEAKLAFEHLFYMVSESMLRLSEQSIADMRCVAAMLNMSEKFEKQFGA